MEVVRTDEEIARVENWAFVGVDQGSHYAGMSYEQGVMYDSADWIIASYPTPFG